MPRMYVVLGMMGLALGVAGARVVRVAAEEAPTAKSKAGPAADGGKASTNTNANANASKAKPVHTPEPTSGEPHAATPGVEPKKRKHPKADHAEGTKASNVAPPTADTTSPKVAKEPAASAPAPGKEPTAAASVPVIGKAPASPTTGTTQPAKLPPKAAAPAFTCSLAEREQPRGGRLDVMGSAFGQAPVVRIAQRPARMIERRPDRIGVQVPADSDGGEVTLQSEGHSANCGSLVIIGKNR